MGKIRAFWVFSAVYMCHKQPPVFSFFPHLVDQLIGEKEEHQKKHGYLEKVLSYIDAHFAEPMTLEMLAEKAMVSRTYLCRCFRDTTGQTVFAYIEQTRIDPRHRCR